MLRPTAAKAFGPGRGHDACGRDPAAPRDRLQAIERFFAVLHGFLDDGVSGGVPGRVLSRHGSWRLSRPHPVRDGVEFVLETPSRSIRFLNNLTGMIHVGELTEDGVVPREIFSAQHTPDGFQPIRKVLGPSRSGFQFTAAKTESSLYLSAHTLEVS